MNEVLVKDTELRLPDFTLVTASAGAGKTTKLTQRYLQLLMSERVRFNNLQNILAITFTNNAAAEMKQRIFEYLKKAYVGDKKIIRELQVILSFTEDRLRRKAEEMIDKILDNYSDFQVQTIDSFLARILRISALEFGYSPDVNISLTAKPLLDEALDLLARELTVNPSKQELLERVIDLIMQTQSSDSKFLWNPFEKISKEVSNVYHHLSNLTELPLEEDLEQTITHQKQKILECVLEIGRIAKASGFTISANYQKIIEAAKAKDFESIISKSLGQNVLKQSKDKKFESVQKKIEVLQEGLLHDVAEYTRAKARAYYVPYVRAYNELMHLIDDVKRRRGEVYIGEANKQLAQKINALDVPEIYFRLGERIHHYLIDEFQDTSPLQWTVLRPLIENSLSEAGSLFIVGDMKQSIYTFRGADWRIMRKMNDVEEFPSVKCQRKELTWNWRSKEAVVEFTKKVFHELVPSKVDKEIAEKSGLSSYQQNVRDEEKGKGFVLVTHVVPDVDEKNSDANNPAEQQKLIEILRDCKRRGYKYSDIAILTPKNKHVIEVSRWLNNEGIQFISHSSLDIRARKITGELIALMKFLDSPIDDLSFAGFLLSEIFARSVGERISPIDVHSFILDVQEQTRNATPLYSLFREKYPDVWENYFEKLFSVVGYLPVYALVVEIYVRFRLFERCKAEEAALVKFLEVIKNFEDSGNNSLKDFLEYAGDSEDEEWNIDVAKTEEAVTVMTVHKAKGLGFPIVITLLYDSTSRADNLFVANDHHGVRLLRITQKDASVCDDLSKVYENYKVLRQVDDLNKLYVALTRAREEQYVLCVREEKANMPSSLLPEDGFSQGIPTKAEQRTERIEREATLHHEAAVEVESTKEFEAMRIEETRRGEFIHAVLERITYVDAQTEQTIETTIRELGKLFYQEAQSGSVAKVLKEFLSLPEIQPLYTQADGRKVFVEQEIMGDDGRLRRLDRLIVDKHTVTVIDFKTGDEQDSYVTQVKEYMEIVGRLFPDKQVYGVLAYVDRKAVRQIQ
jgi:ATP-dependent exoDNAse (exonuclease V) beta subunit